MGVYLHGGSVTNTGMIAGGEALGAGTYGAQGGVGVLVNGGTLTTQGPNVANSTLGSADTVTVNSGGTIVTGTASAYNSLIGSSGTSSKTIRINAGGLIVNPFATSNHMNAVLLDGGTLSAAGGNENSFGNWNFDGGVSTAGRPSRYPANLAQ